MLDKTLTNRVTLLAGGLVALSFAGWSCGSNAGIAAVGACENVDLASVCPIGTTARLDSQAAGMCAGSAGVQVIQQSGNVAGACASMGGCTVFCEPDESIQCEHGIESITRESLVCRDQAVAAACGNSVCDAGENAGNCPLDCSGVCSPGDERCNGADREMCNLQGRWETVSCIDGERCVESGDITACAVGGIATANPVVMQQQQQTIVNNTAVQQATVAHQNNQQVHNQQVHSQNGQQTSSQQNSSNLNSAGTGTRTVYACADATFDCMNIAPGFQPDPLAVSGRSGGADTHPDCDGYFAGPPDHLLMVRSDIPELAIGVLEATGPVSMHIIAVDGSNLRLCSQPQTGPPMLSRAWPAGTYAIWVGSKDAPNSYHDYELRLSDY